ncbi:methyltransferase domain-containing protein [Microbulbifer sp. ALW1]|uniref:methyltransferase domain-containing protein n=1 Tax=Microbulbifer sp. (strain ALW1) TaxID=1516059 RepID=UPI0013584F3A|nr:class I SAM-dependent methyltransferase [Microbulbifer sp. ALW1]
MALVWEKQVGGNRYQVRKHGASVRLYSNGVFHSQWNPRDPLKGSLWELLLLPAFFLPEKQIQRVLLLGVGGGALIRLLQKFVQPESIVGVDIDPVHLTVARRYFGVQGVELVCADAREFIAGLDSSNTSAPFDLIVDDLFGHSNGEVARAFEADGYWCSKLLRQLSPAGAVVSNFVSRRELLASGWRQAAIRERLQGAWTAQSPLYDNCIGVFSRVPLDKSNLLTQAPAAINPNNPFRKLDSQLRALQ